MIIIIIPGDAYPIIYIEPAGWFQIEDQSTEKICLAFIGSGLVNLPPWVTIIGIEITVWICKWISLPVLIVLEIDIGRLVDDIPV